MAAIGGNAEIIEKLWEWAKEIQNRDEINKNLFLFRDKKERTAIHMATHWKRMEVLEKLREFANEETTMAGVVKIVVSHKQLGTNRMTNCGDTWR